MTVKKLTVAAAIAVGIATCSLSNTMAACPCNSGNSSQDNMSCPKEVTPDNAQCPSIDLDGKQQLSSSNCKSEDKFDMKQVYSYPNAVYGDNNYVGEQKNSIYSTHEAFLPDLPMDMRQGSTVLGGNSITGAAANVSDCNMPVIHENAILQDSANRDRNEAIDIKTQSSIEAIRKSFEPLDASGITGAAAPLSTIFPDVPNSYWAEADINRLATTKVVAGYPDRTFKPAVPVSRAEFASMLVRGLNLDSQGLYAKQIFSDVPTCNWANPAISKAVSEGFMKGYCGGKFMPQQPVSRAEALTALSKGINCEIDEAKAQTILSQYCDGDKVPSWATIPVAKALDTGVLKDSPEPNMIRPNKDASRADIASMLQQVRIAGNYDKMPIADDGDKKDKKAYLQTDEIVKIPTLKLKFLDQITAKSSHVGQQFATTTLEDVTINGKVYPAGSRVNGKIVEVIRPSGTQKGALKLAFTTIEDCNGCKAELPKQILNAQINCKNTPNPVARLVTMPFTWTGSLAGIVGRTTGGMISNVGNAVESLTNGTGIAMGETLQGQFKAAGRSLQDASKTTLKAPVDFTRTALSGTIGLFQSTGDEVAYLVDPSGQKIASVNPKEHITIAFGCE